jgi:hypothetical protein
MADEPKTGSDSFEMLRTALSTYLGQEGAELADWMTSQLTASVPESTIMLNIRQQPAYKKRFPAMEYFSGLRQAPSEAEYIASEKEYRTAMAGLGATYQEFYTTDYIGKLMMNDINVDEVRSRVGAAQEYVNSNAPRSVVDALRNQYGMTDGDMVAYLLDPQELGVKIISDFQTKAARAQILGAGTEAGVTLSNATADAIAARDYTYGTSVGKIQDASTRAMTLSKLAAMANGTYSQDEALAAEFSLEGGAAAKTRERKLSSQERARFSRTSAIGNNSLATRGLGTQ